MSKTVVLISCVGWRGQRTAPAREFYVSPLFRKVSAYADRTADEWYVLSAKHGLVSPAQVITPYATTVLGMSFTEREAWAARVIQALQGVLKGGDRVVFLAGKAYRPFQVVTLGTPGRGVPDVPLTSPRMLPTDSTSPASPGPTRPKPDQRSTARR